MEIFPFSKADWDRVTRATWRVTNAGLMDDEVLRTIKFAALERLLKRLRRRYGNHPILLETWADFHDDPRVQVRAYRRAIRWAVAAGLPTLTIRLSLAGTLLDDYNAQQKARNELLACQSELAELADDGERRQWHELMARCSAQGNLD